MYKAIKSDFPLLIHSRKMLQQIYKKNKFYQNIKKSYIKSVKNSELHM